MLQFKKFIPTEFCCKIGCILFRGVPFGFFVCPFSSAVVQCNSFRNKHVFTNLLCEIFEIFFFAAGENTLKPRRWDLNKPTT